VSGDKITNTGSFIFTFHLFILEWFHFLLFLRLAACRPFRSHSPGGATGPPSVRRANSSGAAVSGISSSSSSSSWDTDTEGRRLSAAADTRRHPAAHRGCPHGPVPPPLGLDDAAADDCAIVSSTLDDRRHPASPPCVSVAQHKRHTCTTNVHNSTQRLSKLNFIPIYLPCNRGLWGQTKLNWLIPGVVACCVCVGRSQPLLLDRTRVDDTRCSRALFFDELAWNVLQLTLI